MPQKGLGYGGYAGTTLRNPTDNRVTPPEYRMKVHTTWSQGYFMQMDRNFG